MRQQMKCRVWDKDLRCYIQPESQLAIMCSTGRLVDTSNHPPTLLDTFSRDVEWFACMKDKGGKDIWEGDNIEGNLFDRRVPIAGTVVYDNEHGCWASKNEAGLTFLFKIAEIEVTGNIRENPDLLNPEQQPDDK